MSRGTLATWGISVATWDCTEGGGTIDESARVLAGGGTFAAGRAEGGGAGLLVMARTMATSGNFAVGVPSTGARTGVASSPLSSTYSACAVTGAALEGGGGGAETRLGGGGETRLGGGAETRLGGGGGTGLIACTPLDEGIDGRACEAAPPTRLAAAVT